MIDLESTPPARRGRGGSDSVLAATVARMHFLERRTNLQIAAELGISRFRVARLIDHALSSGIVEITVNAPMATDDRLGGALRRRFGLREALVLPEQPATHDAALLRDAVGSLAAGYLRELCTEGMRIGVSWGKSLDSVAAGLEALPRFPRCDVVQMVGNLPTLEDSLHAGDVLRRFAGVLRGASYALHAPLIVRDAETRAGIRAEESVARTLSMIGHVDVAVVGVGSWDPPSSRLVEVLPRSELRRLEPLHPVADVCALLFDESGREVRGDYADRVIAATAEDLRAIPVTIGVASGSGKARAIRAALAAGVLDVLVTDGATAARLLAERSGGT